MNNAVDGGAARRPRGRVRGHADDRRRDGPAAERVLPRAAAGGPVRRGSARHRAVRSGRCTVALRTEIGPLHGAGDYAVCAAARSPCLRTDRARAPSSPARSAGDPAAQLPRLDQDPVPGPPPVLGERGRHRRRRRDGDRPADSPHELPADQRRPPNAACCWRRTRGARTRCNGARWTRRRGSRRRWTTSSRIHPRIREEYEVGTSHAWYGDRWARGAFALFAPEQQTHLQAAIVAARGPRPLRRRALLASTTRGSRARSRVGHPRREGDPRSGTASGRSPADAATSPRPRPSSRGAGSALWRSFSGTRRPPRSAV